MYESRPGLVVQQSVSCSAEKALQGVPGRLRQNIVMHHSVIMSTLCHCVLMVNHWRNWSNNNCRRWFEHGNTMLIHGSLLDGLVTNVDHGKKQTYGL